MNSLGSSDYRTTSYALGELSEKEAFEFEADMAHDPGLAHETLVMGNFGDLLGKALRSEAKDAKAGRGRDAGIAALAAALRKIDAEPAGQRPGGEAAAPGVRSAILPKRPSTRTAVWYASAAACLGFGALSTVLIGGGEVAVAPAATAGEPEGKIEVSITPENIVEEVIAARAAISGSSTSSSSSFAATSQPEAEEKSSAASYDRSDLVSVRDIVNPADDGPVQRAAVDSGFPLRGEKSDSAEIEQPPKPVMPDGYIEAAPSEPAPASGVPSRGYSFLSAFDYPASTFSIAVDSVSYPRIRHQLRSGRLPHPSDVRIEEILNYFGYDNPEPAGNRPASLKGEIAPCPWEPDNRLVRIALQGRDLAADERPPANLTVLVDASESMESAMPMVRSALAVLVPKLQAEDRISVLTYGGGPGVVLPTTSGGEPAAIRAAIAKLEAANPAAAAGSAGSASLPAAYTAALGGFSKGGANSVILITDGDFNLGVIDAERLVTLIRDYAAYASIRLNIFGVGDAASSEAAMEVLARSGSGHYRFLDSAEEAQRAFSDELGASLVTVAADAKVQVHFNPAEVHSYRLLGYENRLLAADDFESDSDAGDLGAGQAVTALYEIIPVGSDAAERADRGRFTPVVNQLLLQSGGMSEFASGEVLRAQVRLSDPRQGAYAKPVELVERVKVNGSTLQDASDDFRFAAACAGFGMLLQRPEAAAPGRGLNFAQMLYLADSAKGEDPSGQRAEMVELLKAAQRLAAQQRSR